MAPEDRSTEAATLNATLAALATDVAAYLAAGVGDRSEARAAVFAALAGRLNPILGKIEYAALHGSGTNVVPDAPVLRQPVKPSQVLGADVPLTYEDEIPG